MRPRAPVLHGFAGDLRLAARRLAAAPLFAAFAVLSLAAGVGVTTAVFSIVDAIFWQELGIAAPGTVAYVVAADSERWPRYVMSRADFDELRATQRSFASLTGSAVVYPPVATEQATEAIQVEAVDAAYFATLGVQPALGRFIQAADESGSAPVAVLSDRLWRLRFAADMHVVGRTLRVAGRVFEIVGVAPRSFTGPFPHPAGTSLWVPLSTVGSLTPPSAIGVPERDRRRLTVVGRLAPGRSLSSASSEMATIGAALDLSRPRTAPTVPGGSARRGWSARDLTQAAAAAGPLRRFGAVVMALVALVLVVACTNLANLTLARGTLRAQEFAIRRALGASRWRLVREQCAEALVLAVAGGIASGLVLQVLMRTIDIEIPMSPTWVVSLRPDIDLRALTVAAVAMLLALVVFGLEPAMALTRVADVREHLAAAAGGLGTPKVRRQRALLRWQVAISAGFFIIASMGVRYLAADARHDPGVDMDRLAVAVVRASTQRWDEARAVTVLDRVLHRVEAEPGVEAAAISGGMPFGTTLTPSAEFSTTDRPFTREGKYTSAMLVPASPAYFRAAGISILRGRGFDDRDHAGAPRVVVISESAAKALFGTADVVGRQLLAKVDLRTGGRQEEPVRSVTVVGVAEDTDTTHFMGRRGHTAYMPFAQQYYGNVMIVARARNDAAALAALRKGIRSADPDLAIHQIGGGRLVLAGPYVFLRTSAMTAAALGALTLLLAMVGLYGVQSHIVVHRTREIGVRMSFGATAQQIRRMVLADGYRPVLQGLAIGLFIGFVGRALVRAFLVSRVDLVDPWMLMIVPAPLLLAAFCACYWPARRASRMDPNVALRHL